MFGNRPCVRASLPYKISIGTVEPVVNRSREAPPTPPACEKTDARLSVSGVGTAEQLAQVREMGCDLAQGHVFAEAVPGVAAKELVMGGIWSPGRS